MPKEAVVQVRMDKDIKDQVEKVYEKMGTTFSEAVRVFAVQSIYDQGFPFQPRLSHPQGKAFGILSAYANPELIPLENSAMEQELAQKHENDR